MKHHMEQRWAVPAKHPRLTSLPTRHGWTTSSSPALLEPQMKPEWEVGESSDTLSSFNQLDVRRLAWGNKTLQHSGVPLSFILRFGHDSRVFLAEVQSEWALIVVLNYTNRTLESNTPSDLNELVSSHFLKSWVRNIKKKKEVQHSTDFCLL